MFPLDANKPEFSPPHFDIYLLQNKCLILFVLFFTTSFNCHQNKMQV